MWEGFRTKKNDTIEDTIMDRSGKSDSRSCDISRSAGKHDEALLREIEELRSRMDEAESTLQAIQTGTVDVLIVPGIDGGKFFSLEGADYPYRVIVDVMNEGVVTLGSDGIILSCNNRFAHFVKMPLEKILGKSLAKFAPTEDMSKLCVCPKEASGQGRSVTTVLLLEDGTTMPVKLSACAFEVGGLPALCVVVTDLTEMFAATETRLLLASIVETSNDAVISQSLDNRIVTWNVAAEHIYGFSAQEAVGQPISLIVPHDRLSDIEMISKKICLGQHLKGYETIQITKSGILINVSLTVSPLMDPKGNITGVSVIARDITEHKKTEAELVCYREHLEAMVRQRTEQLESANAELKIKISECKRVEGSLRETEARIQDLNKTLQVHVATVDAVNKELESYSHSVSHDLRTPLRFVNRIAHTLLLNPDVHLSISAAKQVEMILQATGEMAKLIENLLTFSQASREPIQIRRIDLQRLFQTVVNELQHLQETKGRCSVDIVIQDMTPCQADRTLLKEVVVNLLENALKFTKRRKKARIRIGCKETTTETVYFIQDNGVGFDMIHLNSLFVPFKRLHRADEFEGTGIGLALVKRIIDRHGGRIWAEGEVDKGATFYFTLGEDPATKFTVNNSDIDRTSTKGIEGMISESSRRVLRKV